jgi:RNA polymerase sigma-70 factor (ECF subfamily)
MNSNDHFEALVNEHYEPLFRFAMSLTRTESDAQDLTQQTFYVWATKGHQLRDLSKVKTWLYTTLHRAFLNSRRRQIRFPHHNLEEVTTQLPVLSPQFANKVDSAQVLVALAGVDEIYRGAVALFYLDDCSYKDIAAVLEVPIGTVRSRIARGIAQLRKIILSDGTPAQSPGTDGISSFPVADKSVEPPRPVPPAAHGRDQLTDEISQPDYDEWDFSSTHLREQLGFV